MSNINNPLPCILINRSRKANDKIILCNDIIHKMLIRHLYFKYSANTLVQIVFFYFDLYITFKTGSCL